MSVEQNDPSGSSSRAVFHTLNWIRLNHLKPVPLQYGQKAAINQDYVQPDYKPPDDALWMARNLGVGVVTGPKAGNLIDVDLDCPEALLFRHFLPASAHFGRLTAPDSHYLYRAVGESEQEMKRIVFYDPDGNIILEIRAGDRLQTVFPGSIHQGTGEEVKWSTSEFMPKLETASLATLIAAAKKIGIATLILRYMWHDGQRNEMCKHLAGLFAYLDWPEEDALAMIEAVMAASDDDDRTRLITVRNTYAKVANGQKVTGAPTLRNIIPPRVVDWVLKWAGSPESNFIQDFNERFAVVTIGGKFRVAETKVPRPGDQPSFMVQEDFLAHTAPERIEIGGKQVSKARVWLTSDKRRKYTRVDFNPGIECDDVLNLWTGWALEPDPHASCQAWLTLLRDVICGGDDVLCKWLLHWFANIVREPNRMAGTAVCIVGVQGAGKTMLVEYFGAILGGAYMHATNDEHVFGRFNKHLATSLLLHADEALYGGEAKHRGLIKSIVTDKTRVLESKGIDARQISNYMRLILTSNSERAAPAENKDRRWTVINMGDRKVSRELIKQVVEERESSGPAALFHYLQTMPYDRDLPRLNIKNDALVIMKSLNRDAMDTWWHGVLMNGRMLPDCLQWSSKPADAAWPDVVTGTALFNAFVLSFAPRRVPISINPVIFGIRLKTKWLNGIIIEDRKVTLHKDSLDTAASTSDSDEAKFRMRRIPDLVHLMHDGRVNAYHGFPDLVTCRLAFEDYVGQKIAWPELDPDAEWVSKM
jgi:hypothetical protein